MFYLIVIKKWSVVLRISNKKENALTKARLEEQERVRGQPWRPGGQGQLGRKEQLHLSEMEPPEQSRGKWEEREERPKLLLNHFCMCQPLFLCWTVFVASLVRRGSQMYVSYNLLSFFVKLSHWKTTTQWGFEIFFGFEIKIQKRTTKWTARWSFTNWTEYTCVPSTQIQK